MPTISSRLTALARLADERALTATEQAEREELQALVLKMGEEEAETTPWDLAAHVRLLEREAAERSRQKIAEMTLEELTIRNQAAREAFGYEKPAAEKPAPPPPLKFPHAVPKPEPAAETDEDAEKDPLK